ncbi:hypothetical protein [Deinococcus budaensis]|uniref:Uncharacterized protein n=1 Tax=Deinococcus budaensis TaxID=1665626 RepID=A0A7W8GCJ7_9DEIO|nr:hypothetical protein [Deinococcus budaensis]MBB5233095.1 hypothetical protein [Deinococcus budaensis]
MGEAKRRKQLGLMPTVHPFEAEIALDGTVTLRRGPDDAALRERLLTALRETQPQAEGWARAYRRAYVLAGLAREALRTPGDLEAIPVPPLRRLAGELVLGFGARTLEDGSPGLTRDHALLDGDGDGAALRVRTRQHSFDGERWQSLPGQADPVAGLRELLRHPLAQQPGRLVASLRAEHWREGRIDFDPEPPEEMLEELEALVRGWHGGGPEGWEAAHLGAFARAEADPPGEEGTPTARRVTLELREETPLGSPFALAFLGGLEVHLDPDAGAYTLDSETWQLYADPGAVHTEEDSSGLGELISSMLDVDTVPVTVWADGRIEWTPGDVPEEHADRLRGDLRGATGAGDPAAWAGWTRALLAETFADEAPWLGGVGELPPVQAVRLDLPTDALADPDDPAQYFIESEVSFDGQAWRDLYAEELPEELQGLRPTN